MAQPEALTMGESICGGCHNHFMLVVSGFEYRLKLFFVHPRIELSEITNADK